MGAAMQGCHHHLEVRRGARNARWLCKPADDHALHGAQTLPATRGTQTLWLVPVGALLLAMGATLVVMRRMGAKR